MSDYAEGSTYESEGKQYEMQELIVDFTDDGRILLEVKGVKVRNAPESADGICTEAIGRLACQDFPLGLFAATKTLYA